MKNSTEREQINVLVNDKQAEFMEAIMYGLHSNGVKVAGLVGGRGGGKSVSLSDTIMLLKEELPRAKGQFAVNVIRQAKRALTPGLKAGWGQRWETTPYNWTTGKGDYVLWREPPPSFDRPYEEPDDWENCISFPNGFVIELCGYRNDPDAHRGRNDDFLLIDEALRFKEDWLKVAVPCVRANKGKYDSNLHWLFAFFSSPPYSVDGQWMFKYEELAKKEPKKYFFVHIKTRDNQQFLPPDYIDNLRATLLDIVFQVEVEGKRITKKPKSFYSALDWNKHTEWDSDKPFYNDKQDLEASLDFNAHFTSCTMWQPDARLLKCVADVFVKQPDDELTMAETLGVRIAERFQNHKQKRITLTGDRNGKNKSAGSTRTMFEQVAHILEQAGWDVEISPLNYNPDHDKKFQLLHDVLSERDAEQYYLRFDEYQAKSTLASMQFTPITADYQKDKSSEKDKALDQELATHLGDTVDYYVIWKDNGGVGYTPSGFDIDFL